VAQNEQNENGNIDDDILTKEIDHGKTLDML
jgi:hypothetical protein